MVKSAWNLDELKSELSKRPEIKSWVIIRSHVKRLERYFLVDKSEIAVDQDRGSESVEYRLRLLVKKSEQKQGELIKTLSVLKPLKAQIDSALESARQSDQELWDLFKPQANEIPQVRSSDPAIAEDMDSTLAKVSAQVVQAALKKRASTYNSSELFLSTHQRELHFSHGLIHREAQTRVYVETAYSSGHQEFLATRWGVSLADIDVETLFEEAALKASTSGEMEAPKSGHYQVLIDSDAMLEIMSSFSEVFSSRRKYVGMPHLAVGQQWVPGATGDKMSIWLDPSLDFGADSTGLSGDGVPQKKLKLVEQNNVVANATDGASACFLKLNPTTTRGTVVVEPGTQTYEQLTGASDQVLEVLQFSSLFPDANTRTFSSEIRLAKLHDNKTGTTKLLKGGSLSASLEANFKNLKLSRDCIKRVSYSNPTAPMGYFGPKYVLLNDVSVVS